MAGSRFHPKPLSTIITFMLCAVLIGLGTWQVQRLHWKEGLLAQIHDNMAQKPVPMPEKFDKPADWQFRRVTLAGTFDYDHEMLVKPRTMDGQLGYDMVVPFTRASGGTVLVDRGWISDALMAKAVRPRGIIQIEGILRAPERPSIFTPENNPARRDWFWADTKTMGAANGLKNLAPMVVYIADKHTGVYPMGGRVQGIAASIPNDHEQYAIFWFGMALVLLVVWFLSHFDRTPALEEKHAKL